MSIERCLNLIINLIINVITSQFNIMSTYQTNNSRFSLRASECVAHRFLAWQWCHFLVLSCGSVHKYSQKVASYFCDVRATIAPVRMSSQARNDCILQSSQLGVIDAYSSPKVACIASSCTMKFSQWCMLFHCNVVKLPEFRVLGKGAFPYSAAGSCQLFLG